MIHQIGENNATIEESDFRAILQTGGQIIVLDFSASWCGPCKLMYPYLEQIQAQFAENNVQIPFYKIDVSDPNNEFCEEVCDDFGIKSLPSLVFMKDGQELFRVEGFTQDGSKLVSAFSQCQEHLESPTNLAAVVQSVFSSEGDGV